MLNLSLRELKLIPEIRGIKGYESISKSESVKESEKNFDDTESTKNKDYNADEILKTTKSDPTKKKKKDKSITRKIREENCDEKKILRDLRFLLDLEKDHYEPKKTVTAFNNDYIQFENLGDKDKSLSIKEYLVIRPYLSD